MPLDAEAFHAEYLDQLKQREDQNMELAEITAEAAWEDTEKLVYQIIHKFQAKWGGEWDDLLSEAHEAFMDALNTFDSGKGVVFNTWLGHKVRWRLMDYRRIVFHRNARECSLSLGASDHELEAKHPAQEWAEIRNGLSHPARMVTDLLTDETGRICPPESSPNKRMRGLIRWVTSVGGGFDLGEVLEEISAALS